MTNQEISEELIRRHDPRCWGDEPLSVECSNFADAIEAALDAVSRRGEARQQLAERLCPQCRQFTAERTSTNNAFCRRCDRIFSREGDVTLSQQQIRELVARGEARQEAHQEAGSGGSK